MFPNKLVELKVINWSGAHVYVFVPTVINWSETRVLLILHTVFKIEMKMAIKLNYFFISKAQGHFYSYVINFHCVYECLLL